MEKRTLLAVVLSLMILIAYQEWVARQYGTPPSPPPPQGEKAKEVEKSAAPTPKAQPVLQEAKPMARPRQESMQEVRVETDHYVALFTNQGARLKSFTLKHYRTSVGEKSPPFEMISPTPGVPYPLGIQLPGTPPLTDEALIYSIQGGNLKLTGDSKGKLIFQGQSPAGVKLTKEFTFSGSTYPIQLELSVEGTDKNPSPGLLLSSDGNNKGAAQDAVFEGLLALVNNKIKREPTEEIKNGKEFSGPVSWAG
ncbi:MAG: membrane protein insertase YidC, partial [Candidatus Binatota bacterium]